MSIARAKSNKNIRNEVYLGGEMEWMYFPCVNYCGTSKLSYREISTKTEYMSKVKKKPMWPISISLGTGIYFLLRSQGYVRPLRRICRLWELLLNANK